jgi:H+/Cl- antiporter ClcA
MIDDYLLILSWLVIAIGAALAGGTGMALLHYRRTGSFPEQPEASRRGTAVQASPRTAIVKCVIGLLLIAWGAFSLLARG